MSSVQGCPHTRERLHCQIKHTLHTNTLTHIGDEDFTQLDLELTLPAGEAQLTVPVSLGPDNIFPGPSKEFEVYLGPAPGAFVSPTAFANVTITDNDPDLPGEVSGTLYTYY